MTPRTRIMRNTTYGEVPDEDSVEEGDEVEQRRENEPLDEDARDVDDGECERYRHDHRVGLVAENCKKWNDDDDDDDVMMSLVYHDSNI